MSNTYNRSVDSDTDADIKDQDRQVNIETDSPIATTQDGAEYEDTGITKPFDPTLINIRTTQMSLDALIARIREKEIDLSPSFQRKEVWKDEAKSRLIESLLIRIPLPAFYMDAVEENRYIVVDGLQRLSTIRDFVIDKKLKLEKLEYLSDLNNKGYDDLSRLYQRRISETQVTVYLIEKGTPPDVKFNIFRRINTGGLPLTAQEIRHALHQGHSTQLLKTLVESIEFKQVIKNGISDERMAARECILRFFAFIMTPPDEYDSDNFDSFLSRAMDRINTMADKERSSISVRFTDAMKYSFSLFKDDAFRKPKVGKNRNPVNKALFETTAIAIDSHIGTIKKINSLEFENVLIQVSNSITDSITEDKKFMDSITQGTGDPAKIKYRFAFFNKALREALEYAMR